MAKPYSAFREFLWYIANITFVWMDPMVWRARFNKLRKEDLNLRYSEESESVNKWFQRNWETQLKLKTNSLFLALFRSFWFEFIIVGFFKLCWSVLLCGTAFYFVRELTAFADNKTRPDWEGGVLSVAFFFACILLSLTYQQMTSWAAKVGVKIRAAMLAAVFQKATRLDMQDLVVGEVSALATNDCSRVMESVLSFHLLWTGALESLAIMGLLIYLVGLSGLPALGAMILLLILQLVFGYSISYLRTKNINTTDSRVSIMSEVLQAIKLVKLYAWEDFFAKHVANIRSKEVILMGVSGVVKTINLMVVFAAPPLIAFCIFIMYYFVSGKLTGPIAFTTLSLFNTLRFPLTTFPRAVRGFAEFITAIRRLQAFLLKPEAKPLPKDSRAGYVKIENADFAYLGTEVLLKGVNVEIQPGKVCGLVGLVGCGKTNFINAILGNMHAKSGTIQVGGKIAYVPQTPWNMSGTVRENILFGMPYEEEKYNKVVKVCALESDFKIMPHGDLTELADKAANLSGGQRQRVALARACYADADLVILDSPLSAVDQHTCMHIFNQCIKDYLKRKTVILITHQLHLLPDCDLVGVMDNGVFNYFGAYNKDASAAIQKLFPSYSSVEIEKQTANVRLEINETGLLSNSYSLDNLVKHAEDEADKLAAPATIAPPPEEKKPEPSHDTFPDEVNTKIQQMKLDHEKFKRGPYCNLLLGWRVWLYECGYCAVLGCAVVYVITQAIRIVSDRWVGWAVTDNFNFGDQLPYIWSYAIYCGVFAIGLTLRGLWFYTMSIRGATHIHNLLFKRVLRAPMMFFNETPVGKLLNCFSKDQDCADEPLPDTIHITMIYVIILLTTVVIVCVTLPYYTIITILLFVSFFVFYFLYSPAATLMKDQAGAANSRLFAHFNETLSGLNVIRAFELQDMFKFQNLDRIDQTHKAIFNLEHLQAWLALRLDFISSILVFATALFAVVFRSSVDGASIGLAISNSFQQLVFYTWSVKGLAEINSYLASMERLNFYAYFTPSEAATVNKNYRPPENWPEKGAIEIKNLYLTYSPNLPPILRNVNISIKPGEKVGVVGRTGSGKTTLLMTLFRLVEPLAGSIQIDNVEIMNLGLHDLRSKIAIIPQEPVLFKGTVRSNLDPFNQYSDQQLWEAVECASLKESLEGMEKKLDSEVVENGNNFSLGQKQLFCLARAVLNKSKVLVFDEATAAMDLETDNMIQKTIRKVFADRTIITIAHRLETIIDSDRILVMEAGKTKEFDSPAQLLRNPFSMFAKLVDQAGESAPSLRQAAFAKENKTANNFSGNVNLGVDYLDEGDINLGNDDDKAKTNTLGAQLTADNNYAPAITVSQSDNNGTATGSGTILPPSAPVSASPSIDENLNAHVALNSDMHKVASSASFDDNGHDHAQVTLLPNNK